MNDWVLARDRGKEKDEAIIRKKYTKYGVREGVVRGVGRKKEILSRTCASP